MLLKKNSVSQRRHLTLVIDDHDVLFYKRVKNYVTFSIMTFSNIVDEIRTLFARNSLYDTRVLGLT
jgi:hypothetical protein